MGLLALLAYVKKSLKFYETEAWSMLQMHLSIFSSLCTHGISMKNIPSPCLVVGAMHAFAIATEEIFAWTLSHNLCLTSLNSRHYRFIYHVYQVVFPKLLA